MDRSTVFYCKYGEDAPLLYLMHNECHKCAEWGVIELAQQKSCILISSHILEQLDTACFKILVLVPGSQIIHNTSSRVAINAAAHISSLALTRLNMSAAQAMSLLPINPADFPDVPTRKALIALDLQNDFLAADGALPVTQPDGMVSRIVKLAEAVRASGYGEVIWVRSQFDTSRTAGEQQIMSAETPQMPARPGSSGTRRSHPAAVDGDSEAFLSVVEGQAKPECVRKGTTGAEFLPAIAAAKGPKDYAMTKSYYSAFQSGQLLNLLRRQFATELIICGSLSNVSVYATALAASSHGLDITIAEDCCGYRSEMRHMNAARRLMDQTGCEFANAEDIIPTLKPKSPSSTTPANGRSDPPGPPQIPPELIAAAMAGGKNKGIPVRPKTASSSSSSPVTPTPDHTTGKGKEEKATTTTTTKNTKTGEEQAKKEKARSTKNTKRGEEAAKKERYSKAASRSPPLLHPTTPPTDLLVSMEKLKLNTELLESVVAAPTAATTTTRGGDKVSAVLQREDDSPQTWEHVVAWDVRV